MRMRKRMRDNRTGIRYIGMPILFLCLLFGVTGCGDSKVVSSYTEEEVPVDEVPMFAIVSSLDEVNGKITLRSVTYDTEVVLTYNGGVDVRDKYGDILSVKQIVLGSIVDAVYDANRSKLLSMYLSSTDKVQKLEQVSGLVVDNVGKTVQINGTSYPMSQNISAFSDYAEIGVDEVCSEDQVTLWLYNDLVCSIYVELGHGYVRLSDYASYIGGMVEIGYDVIVPVTEDMLLTVREGEYTLRISKNSDVGTKKVQVARNQEVDISLADIAVEPKQMGSVLFQVKPAEAVVYIDGKQINTEGAVPLVYGKHRIDITADGYDSYSASFNVKYAYKVKEYSLNQTGSETETSTQSTTSAKKMTRQKTEAATDKAEETTEAATTEASDAKDVQTATGTKTNNKVTVSAPIGASVYFDGEFLGIAPISFTKVTGSHIITFSQTGYLSKSYTVTFADDGKDDVLQYEDLVLIASLIED